LNIFRKRIFEAYQKFLKINPASYTASSNIFLGLGLNENLKKESNTPNQHFINTHIFTKVNTTPNLQQIEKNSYLNALGRDYEKEKNYGDFTNDNKFTYYDSNRYKSTDSFFNLDQYAQPFTLTPQEHQKSNEAKTYVSSINNINIDGCANKTNDKTNIGFSSPISINSSQLFNDYFIKNNLNK